LASLLTNITILKRTFPTSALHPTSISVLSATFALFLTQKLSRQFCLCYCRFQIRLCQFHCVVFSVFKTSWLESLLAQLPTPPQLQIHFISFQFSNESILNWLLMSTVHSTTLALNTCHLYYFFIRHRVSFALPPSISSPNILAKKMG